MARLSGSSRACRSLRRVLGLAFGDRLPLHVPRRIGEEPADLARLKALLGPYPSEGMICWPVSPRVGNARNNDSSLIEPVAAA